MLFLALPAPSFAADEADWGFRQSFRSYVYSSTGPAPLTAAAGATCDPNPDTVRGGCDPKLASTTDIFGWTAVDASYALPSGAGTIDLEGAVTFKHADHMFDMTIIDPIVTVDSAGDAILSVYVDLNSDFPAVPDYDGRLSFGEYELTGPVTVTATSVTWLLGNGKVTAEAATALGNFLPPGAALDPIRIVLPLVGGPVASSSIQLKDDPAKPDKRAVAVGVSKQSVIVPAEMDPAVDGASVRVVSSTFDHTYALPAANWKATIKKGVVTAWTYKDSKRLAGPISSVKLTIGGLKIGGKGEMLNHSLGVEPQNVTIVLSSGNFSTCPGVGAGSTTTYKTGKQFKAAKNPAPAACPAPPAN